MTLQEKLDAHKADFESKLPPEKLAIMHRVTEDLRQSGILEGVVRIGQPAPEFVLPNLHGEKVSSPELLRHGPLLVTFYRGVW